MFRPPPRSTLFPTRRSSDLYGPEPAPRVTVAPCAVPSHVLASDNLAHAIRREIERVVLDRKSTRLNSSHRCISYAVFCLKKKKQPKRQTKVHVTQVLNKHNR